MSQPSSAEDQSGVPQEQRSAAPPPDQVVEDVPVEVLLRRAPRYRPFVGTGAVLGALLLLGSGLLAVRGKGFPTLMLPLDLVLVGALVGGLLGAGAALLVERRRPA